jgi:hypothetical protein
MPTLALLRGTPPDDVDALGDWTASKHSKMRVRYADSREEKAAAVKLEHVLVVRDLANLKVPLAWSACQQLLVTLDPAPTSAEVGRALADDCVVEETAESLLQGLARPKRRFNISALAKRRPRPTMSSAPTQPAPSGAVECQLAPQPARPLPLNEPGASRLWVVVKYRGAPHVHILQDAGQIPLCRRRQGRAGQPLVRLQGAGEGLVELHSMGWGPTAVCAVCFHALRQDEQRVLRCGAA